MPPDPQPPPPEGEPEPLPAPSQAELEALRDQILQSRFLDKWRAILENP